MRLVADDEVEGWRAVSLRISHPFQRLVGAEDHGHGIRPRLPQTRQDAFGAGRHRLVQFQQGDILVRAADARVGANALKVQGQTVLLAPFVHRLGHQGDGGDDIENATAYANLPFRNPERDHGLARAAGQDQLAAFAAFKTRAHRVNGLRLKGMRIVEPGWVETQGLRVVDVLQPIHRPNIQMRPAQHTTMLDFGIGFKRAQGMTLKVGAGVDQNARGEGFRRGCRQKGIDGALGHGHVGRVELALDGAQAAVRLFGHQIDAQVRPRSVRPFMPEPDFGEALAEEVMLLQGAPQHALEAASLLRFACGFVAKTCECFIKVRHGSEVTTGLIAIR